MIRSSAMFTVVLIVSAAFGTATPLLPVDGAGPSRWRNGATINVYIPLDPARNDPDASRTRHVQLVEAVNSWKEAMDDFGITLNPVQLDANGNVPGTGKPPDANAEGSVVVRWTNTASGEGGVATPSTVDGGDHAIVNVDIEIGKGTTANKARDEAKAKAAMLHEIGHALGLDHDEAEDSVLHKDLDVEFQTEVGKDDLAEIKSIYAAAGSLIIPEVTFLASGEWSYGYEVRWSFGADLSLFQVFTRGVPITSVQIPDGWEAYNYAANKYPQILAFRVVPTKGLQAYINSNLPSLEFGFVSPSGPGTVLTWAGDTHLVAGPVPEPSSVALGAIGLVCLAWYWRKLSRA